MVGDGRKGTERKYPFLLNQNDLMNAFYRDAGVDPLNGLNLNGLLGGHTNGNPDGICNGLHNVQGTQNPLFRNA